MVIAPFEIAGLPAVTFGEGTLGRLPDLVSRHGSCLLLVTGARSFKASVHASRLAEGLRERGLRWEELEVAGEPSPRIVDQAVARLGAAGIQAVVGIGGGSALDVAKAVAGLLRTGRSVMDHLEGVGRGVPYTGPALPFLAVPTTAGTGTEATRNAVLSVRGKKGFKRSFRHEVLVARAAIVDPLLLESCPPPLVAADGMDALTQLLESYVSARSSPFTDALAESGLASARVGLLPWYEGTGDPRAARAHMAFASLLSGIALAHAGLGAVHGVASPLGAFFPVPHGVVCGTLVAAATEINVEALRSRAPLHPALGKYARAFAILSGTVGPRSPGAPDALVALLAEWTRRLDLPRLGRFGVSEADVPRLVAESHGGSMKSNPIPLTDEEIGRIVSMRL